MSYSGISIKEVMNFINYETNGWYLPTIQRPYVWGDRHESEKYICKLFDSILKGYPIGNIIVWNCITKVPFKDFSKDYYNDIIVENRDESVWSKKDKWLVYDGQQRLQTLYSCLRYSVNGRVLVYDLLSQDDPSDLDKVGFYFVDKNSVTAMPFAHIKMSELYGKSIDDKAEYRKAIFKRWPSHEITNEEELEIEKRLDRLFNVFINKDSKVLAYYQLDENFTEDQVNEVFQRINSGGVPLSGADLLFSRIKQQYYSFEEDTLKLARTIKELTSGLEISHYFILLILNVIIKATTRIDATKVKPSELTKFKESYTILEKVLKDFYQEFIFNMFKINNASLIVRGNALIPLIIYAYHKKDKYHMNFKDIEIENLMRMKKYFVLSQYNDWNTQTILTKNSELALSDQFRLDEMTEFVRNNGRIDKLSTNTLEYYRKFSLKIILRHRLFVNTSSEGRYNPELDHIYPVKLEDRTVGYDPDVLWNMQPIDGTTNLDKSNQNPNTYFQKKPQVKDKYDFIDDIDQPWLDFIIKRKSAMIKQFEQDYNTKLDEEDKNEIQLVKENLKEMALIQDQLSTLPIVFPSKNIIDIKLGQTKNVAFIWKLDDGYKCGIWMNKDKNKLDVLKDTIMIYDNSSWFGEYKNAITIGFSFSDNETKNQTRQNAIDCVKKLYDLANPIV